MESQNLEFWQVKEAKSWLEFYFIFLKLKFKCELLFNAIFLVFQTLFVFFHSLLPKRKNVFFSTHNVSNHHFPFAHAQLGHSFWQV